MILGLVGLYLVVVVGFVLILRQQADTDAHLLSRTEFLMAIQDLQTDLDDIQSGVTNLAAAVASLEATIATLQAQPGGATAAQIDALDAEAKRIRSVLDPLVAASTAVTPAPVATPAVEPPSTPPTTPPSA